MKDSMLKKARAFVLPSFFLFPLLLFFFITTNLEAATCTWIGGTGTNASTAANWSNCGGVAPQTTDAVVINATADLISWDSSAVATVASLALGSSYTGTTTLARSLIVTGDVTVDGGGLSTGTQDLTVQGGDMTVASGKMIASGATGTTTLVGTGMLGGAGVTSLANLVFGGSATLSASTTFAGNIAVTGNCNMYTNTGGSGLSVVVNLSNKTLSCGGNFIMGLIGGVGETVVFNAGNGSLTVTGPAMVRSSSALVNSTITFNGDSATLSFGGHLLIEAAASLLNVSSFTRTTFNAGTSGTLSVTGSTTLRSGTAGFSYNNLAVFDGGGKTVTFTGPVQMSTLGTDTTGGNGTYFYAGTSASTTFSDTFLAEVISTVGAASTTFYGQAKNLQFNSSVTIGAHGTTAGDITFTPSTGNSVIYGNLSLSDSGSSASGASANLGNPSSAYNMSFVGNITVTDGAGSGSISFLPTVGTTTFAGTSAQTLTLPSGAGLNNVVLANTGSSTLTLSGNASSTNFFINQGTLVSGANTLTVTGYYKNNVGASGTTWTDGTLYINGRSQTIPGSDTYNVLQIGGNTDVRMNASSAGTHTVDATGSLYSTDHAGVDGELYIFGDYHVPTFGSASSQSTYNIDYWSYATDFNGTSLSGGSERQVKVYIHPDATVTVGNVAGAGPKRLKIIGTASFPTLISRQGGSGHYTFKVDKGRLHANYFNFDYLDTSGLQLTNAAVIPQLSNGTFDNVETGGSFITISNATTTLVADTLTFNNTGSAGTYNIRASGGGVNWRLNNSAGTFDGESYDNPTSGASLLWSDSTVSTSTPTISATSIQWNFTESAGSEKAFALFDTNRNYKLSPSIIHQFATGTITIGYIGDSLTSGVTGFTNSSPTSDFLTDNGTDGYPSQLDGLLDQTTGLSTVYYNGGIGGWITAYWGTYSNGSAFAPATFNAFYTNALSSLGENPDLVLILTGTNDLGTYTASEYKTLVSDIVSGVVANGGIPVLSFVSPFYTDSSSGIETYVAAIAEYNTKLVEIADETEAILGPDLYGALGNYTTLLGQDAMYYGEVHFQELGFSAIANEWMDTLMLRSGNTTSTANLTSITETGLTPNTSYQRVIYPMNAAGLGQPATTSAVYTLAAIPTSGSASRSGSDATVSWSSNGNPSGTEYFVTNTTGGTDSGWITDTSTTFSNVGSSEAAFTVKARNGDGTETSNLHLSLSGGGGTTIYGGGGGGGSFTPQTITTPQITTSTTTLRATSSLATSEVILPYLTGPFSFGMTSTQVRVLQEYLAKDSAIYPEGLVTGYYGELTKKAVARFQDRFGLATPQDDFYGLAGPQTRAKISSTLGTSGNNELNQARLALIESLKKQIAILVAQVTDLLEKERTKKLCVAPSVFTPCTS